MLKKLKFYSAKYGFVHAVSSYIGRYNFQLWQLIGPLVTKKYMSEWLKKTVNANRILNLGGGGNCIDGCLTVDISPRADVYVDLMTQLPFEDSSFDAIFCEEAIEHIPLNQAEDLLKECLRILKEGGVLRISTPDLNYFAEQVLHETGACNAINQIFYEHTHRYIYTRQALQEKCLEAGFENVRSSSYKDSNSRLGYLDSHADRFSHPPEISQYLEAEKT